MPKHLVIVESPAKAKTINKFLGKSYEVLASNGHVRDLPKSQLGVDVEKDFDPKYITIRGKGELLAKLRKEVKKADKVYLATDPDREGEAISWHLLHALKLDEKNASRITFNEITKNAVKQSIKQARKIDMSLVDAQQARRVLDRIVGYKISPLLWTKVKKGLSAGRVQSVALRLICDREEEINAFIPEEYWSLEVALAVDNKKENLIAKYYGVEDTKTVIASENALNDILTEIHNKKYEILDVKKGERIKKAPLPFITSTLQQEASKKMNFSTLKTMRVAQQLYEGIEIGNKGSIGLITYLRTDSTRISEEAEESARTFIEERYGKEYVEEARVDRRKGKKVQDAHEAIRPTDITLTPYVVKDYLSRDQYRLYTLIWNRFVASRMKPAIYETTSIRIMNGKHRFTASTSKIIFEGFQSVYNLDEEKEKSNSLLANLQVGNKLVFQSHEAKQHFTQPAPHYTEASLVRALEELGIGRPSTYAPTITTIMQRRYVVKENKNLYVSELGEIVNQIMKLSFPDIIDVNFTADLERQLDAVEEGDLEWKEIIRKFYPNFIESVEVAEKEIEEVKIGDEVTEVICEICGRNMVIKYGPHGRFLACPGFPDCKNTKPYYEKIGISCPKCNGEIVIRKTKKGRKYYGCENIPDCDYMTWQKPTQEKCPKCGNLLVEKGTKLVCQNEKCVYKVNKQ